MTRRAEHPTKLSAPRSRPISMELTPAEYDSYLCDAQRMRAEAMAGIIERCFASFRRISAREHPAPDIARGRVGSRAA